MNRETFIKKFRTPVGYKEICCDYYPYPHKIQPLCIGEYMFFGKLKYDGIEQESIWEIDNDSFNWGLA